MHSECQAERSAYEKDAIWVDLGVCSGVGDGVENVLDGQFRTGGFGVAVRAAKIRVNIGPFVLDAMILDRLVQFLTIVGAPAMKGDHQ